MLTVMPVLSFETRLPLGVTVRRLAPDRLSLNIDYSIEMQEAPLPDIAAQLQRVRYIFGLDICGCLLRNIVAPFSKLTYSTWISGNR
jgi:hypothetical protein